MTKNTNASELETLKYQLYIACKSDVCADDQASIINDVVDMLSQRKLINIDRGQGGAKCKHSFDRHDGDCHFCGETAPDAGHEALMECIRDLANNNQFGDLLEKHADIIRKARGEG